MLRLKYQPGSIGLIATFHLRRLLKLPWMLRRTCRHLMVLCRHLGVLCRHLGVLLRCLLSCPP